MSRCAGGQRSPIRSSKIAKQKEVRKTFLRSLRRQRRCDSSSAPSATPAQFLVFPFQWALTISNKGLRRFPCRKDASCPLHSLHTRLASPRAVRPVWLARPVRNFKTRPESIHTEVRGDVVEIRRQEVSEAILLKIRDLEWRWGGCRSHPNGIAMCHTRGVEAQAEGEGIYGRGWHHRR